MSKAALIFILGVAAVLLGGLCFRQHGEIAEQGKKIAALEKAAEPQAFALEAARREAETARQQGIWLKQESESLRSKLHDLQAAAAPSGSTPEKEIPKPQPTKKPKGLKGMFAEMMRDPAMRESMLKQSEFGIVERARAITKALRLTPEQGQALTDLLVKQGRASMERAFDANGETDGHSPVSVANNTGTDDNKAIQELLGAAKFKQYKDYQDSALSRMQIDAFKKHLASSQVSLQDFQAEGLRQMIQEESHRRPATLQPAGGDMNAVKALEQSLARQQDINQRVLNRAPTLLNAAQIRELADFQTRQMQQQKMNLEMTRKMMAPQPDGAQ